jgi:hypothetical protein
MSHITKGTQEFTVTLWNAPNKWCDPKMPPGYGTITLDENLKHPA